MKTFIAYTKYYLERSECKTQWDVEIYANQRPYNRIYGLTYSVILSYPQCALQSLNKHLCKNTHVSPVTRVILFE